MPENGLDLANLFLNLADSQGVAELREEISAEKHLIEELEEESESLTPAHGDGNLNELTALSDAIDELGAEDPLATFFKLSLFNQRLSTIDISTLNASAKDRLEEVSEKLNEKRETVLKNWDEATGEKIRQLGDLMTSVRRSLDLILARIHESHADTDRERILSLTNQVEKLARTKEQIKDLVARVPGIETDGLPGWQSLEKAENAIIKPHYKNVFLFKCAVLMTRADGEISALEKDFLQSIGERIHLSPGETETLIRQAGKLGFSNFEADVAEAQDLIHKLYLCALADGVVAESEKRMLQRIARAINLDEGYISSLLSGSQHSEVNFLDPTTVKKCVRTQARKPENAFLADDIPPGRLADLCKKLEVPADETPLLVYDNCFLDKSLESAILTGGALYFTNPRGVTKCVQLSNIEDCRTSIKTSVIELKDGRKLKMSRAAFHFLELVLTCIDENLRSV
ncbi:MAG: TerB family tellurite resistance protein [Candidatus Brocadiia bacterium]